MVQWSPSSIEGLRHKVLPHVQGGAPCATRWAVEVLSVRINAGADASGSIGRFISMTFVRGITLSTDCELTPIGCAASRHVRRAT
jgi:hypothetical protein